nr:hypothetical protein [Tanacetum cinerariifolium]
MYDDYIGGQPSTVTRTTSATQAPQNLQTPTTTTTIIDNAPTPTNSFSQATNNPNTSQDVDELKTQQQHIQQQYNQAPLSPEIVADNVSNAMIDENTFVNPFATPSTSAAESSSSQYVDPSNMHMFYQPYPHEYQWTKDHPLEQVIREPSQPVLTRNQLKTDGDMCMYALTLKRLDVWVLVPPLNNIKPLTLKWLFKNKHDEENTIIINKTYLVVRGYRQEEGIENFIILSKLWAWYQAKPTEKHLKEVKRIFPYLWGTVNMGVWYTKDFGFELTGFPDADYAGSKDTFKSTFSGTQFLGEKLLTDYGFYFNKIPIYCDSKSAIAISCNPVQHLRTKHIVICYHFIKEHVEKGTIELYFVKTDYQLADLFTKALPVDRFNYFVCRLGLRSLSLQELERLAKS